MSLQHRTNMKQLPTIPFAHRGLHDNQGISENSLQAISWTVREGFGIEIDVRVLADGQPVLFHDEDLYRMTGASGKIEEKSWEDVRELHLLGTHNTIPHLSEALSLIDASVPVFIDMKSHAPTDALQLVKYLKAYSGWVTVISQNPEQLNTLQPHNCGRGLVLDKEENLSDLEGWERVLWYLRKTYRYPPDIVCASLLQISSLEAFLLRLHRPLVVWTVKNEQQRQWSLRYADNYMFEIDRPISLAIHKDRELTPLAKKNWEWESA